MENYIIELISVAGTFIAAYLGSLWALKNVKKEKYFEERKQIYYELASILPIIDTCITQSDYLQDCQLGGTAENKIVSEQNRCAMACQGCGAVFLLFLKKAVDYFLKSIYC